MDFFSTATNGNHIGAGFGKSNGNGFAEAAGSPEDKRVLPFKA